MSACATPILAVSDIVKSFTLPDGGVLPVLSGISLSLNPGSITAILGASGCGKSTLLSMLAGLIKPDDGSISSEFARPGEKLGLIQQSQRLLPWRTVLENVALGLELTGSSKIEARKTSLEFLIAVGMKDFIDYFPSQLSGGMNQRVLIARALITKPSLLLLDEPLGQLDIIARKALASMIIDYVATHSAATVIVTHSVEEAIFIADHVIILTQRPSSIFERFSIIGNQSDLRTKQFDEASTSCGNSSKRLLRSAAFDTVQEALINASLMGPKVVL